MENQQFTISKNQQLTIWNDPEINVIWPHTKDNYIFSDKDKKGKALSELSLFN